MKDAQKPDHVSLSKLISNIRDGQYEIPDFQREFVWEPSAIRDLMRSIFLDYYIGTLLLWKGKVENFETLSCEPIQHFTGSRKSKEYIVLDGQQRLSAIHYAVMAPDRPAPRRKNRYLYFLRVDRFLDEAHDEAFVHDWTAAGRKLLDDAETQYQTHKFPLAVLGREGWALADWANGYRDYWKEQVRLGGDGDSIADRAAHASRQAEEFSAYLKGIYEQYQVTYIELDRDLKIEKVCDIFQKINSTGQDLDIFDLLNAILRPKGVHLKHLWRDCKERLAFAGARRMNIYVLQVMSILAQDGPCSPKYLYYLIPRRERTIRQPDGSHGTRVHIRDEHHFVSRWAEAVAALEDAIQRLRSDYGVTATRFLPYASILPAFASLQKQARSRPDAYRMDAQKKLTSWYWASVFTSRYSSAVESTAAADYRDLRRWFENDDAEPDLIGELREAHSAMELRRETSRASAVYCGLMNLIVLQGAKDWVDGSGMLQRDLDDHHIVPRARCLELGIGGDRDSVLNRTLLPSETNRTVIRDRLPCEYLPEWIEKSGKNAVRQVLDTHLVSPRALKILLREPFKADDFEEFLLERQLTMRRELGALLPETLPRSSPGQLVVLNGELEKVELALRELVNRRLEGRSERVPSNVLGKVRKRIRAEFNRNPTSLRPEQWPLRDELAYFDLREIEHTICAKTSWSFFESVFRSKETLAGRFSQLAELRNSIRHSRSVDEVTIKDGEAAIHWFTQTLR